MPAIQPAVDAIPWAKPIVHEGKRKQQILVTSLNNEDEPRESIQSYLVKSHQPILYAYQRIPNQKRKLSSDGSEYIVLCYALDVVENTPASEFEDLIIATKGGEQQPNIVVIKVFNKSMLSVQAQSSSDHLKRNPYNGITALQALGDDTHVERCLEALEDEQYIYIVTPYIGRGLHSIIPWNAPAFSEDVAKNYFLKILKSLQYIHQHDVCHCCINTESILIDENETNAVMTDMEMSLRVRKNETTGEYNLLRYMGRYGTLPHMPPEIYKEQDFDGFAADIWSLGVVLFNMLTGEHLYHYPSNTDAAFNHFVIDDGLRNDYIRSIAANEYEQFQLLRKRQRVQQLGSSVRNLLHNMLRVNSRERYTIDEIFAHPWVDGIMSLQSKLTETEATKKRKILDESDTHATIGSSIMTGAVASASQETKFVTTSSTAEKEKSKVAEDKKLNTGEVGSITPETRIPLQSVTDAMESHKYEWSRIPSKMIVERKYCAIVVVYDKHLGQDKVIVFGGGTDIVECWHILSDDNNKDGSEECWKRLCPMPIALEGCAAVTVRDNGGEDYVYVIGGYNSNAGGSQNSVYRYNVQKDVWERMSDMKIKRSYLACIVKNRIIYAIGGSSTGEFSGALDTVEMCNTNISDEPNDWVVLNSKMKSKRFKFCACTINPTYAFGGIDENDIVLDTVEVNRSIETGGEWEQVSTRMSLPRFGHALACLANNIIRIIGGMSIIGKLLTMGESYDTRTNEMISSESNMQSNLPAGDGVAATTGAFPGHPAIVTIAIFGGFGFILQKLYEGKQRDEIIYRELRGIRRDTRNILSNQEVTLSILSQLQATIIENIPRLFILLKEPTPSFNVRSMNEWSRSLIKSKYLLYFVCAEGTGYAGPIEMWRTKDWFKKYGAPALGVSLFLLKYSTRILTGMDLPIGNQMFCLSIQGVNDMLNDLLDDTESIDTVCKEKLREIEQCLRTGERISDTHVQGLIGESYNMIAKKATKEENIRYWRNSMIPVRIKNSNPSIIVWVMRDWCNDPNNNAQDKYALSDADEINRQHIT